MLAMGRISQLRARPQKPHSMCSGAADAFKGQTRNHLHTQVLYKHLRGSQTLSPQNPDSQVPRRSLGFTDHLPQNTQIFDAAAFPGCTALGAQPGAQEAELTAAGLSSFLPISFGPSSPSIGFLFYFSLFLLFLLRPGAAHEGPALPAASVQFAENQRVRRRQSGEVWSAPCIAWAGAGLNVPDLANSTQGTRREALVNAGLCGLFRGSLAPGLA